MVERQVNGGNKNAEFGKQLTEDPRSHSAGYKACEKNGEESCCGGEEANGQHGIAEDQALDVQQEKRKRRLIDISPLQMIAACEVVQFVAVETVSAYCEQVNDQFQSCRNQEDEYFRAHPPTAMVDT